MPKHRRWKKQTTVAGLEGCVSRRMIEDCKLDACVDWFLKGFEEVWPLLPEYGFNYDFPDFTIFDGEDAQKVDTLRRELRENMNYVLPDYLPPGESDPFTDERLKLKLTARVNLPFEKLFADGTTPPEPFRDALLHTLMEQRYQHAARSSDPEAPSLSHQAEVEACRQLRDRIEGVNVSASFACGGVIPISDPSTTTESASMPRRFSAPISILWALADDSKARKLVLPITDGATESSQATLQQLVQDCTPATFGRGQEDVFDPDYRRAGKLDPRCFATTFHPADFGIIESIERVLLPSICTEMENQVGFRKLTAELYKLNVYSGPSGLFRKHVDTPRSDSQIGSLVVCLPSSFHGGVFTVQHNGQNVKFDWSNQSASSIQWAAFYSDCEHEIETVSEGERITLTYNLYVSNTAEQLGSANGIVQPQSLPLYGFLEELISDPHFMAQGGVLGIYCSHAYPHNSEIAQLQLPSGLKGADLVLYSALKALSVEIDVLPVLEFEGRYGSGNPELKVEDCIQDMRHYIPDDESTLGLWERCLQKGSFPTHIPYHQFTPPELRRATNIDEYWKLLLLSRRVIGFEETAEHLTTDSSEARSTLYGEAARVGTRRRPYTVTDEGREEPLDQVSGDVWPMYYLPGITWITEPKHEQMAFTQITYGNEASIGSRYSCAAILAVIPAFAQRKQKLDSSRLVVSRQSDSRSILNVGVDSQHENV